MTCRATVATSMIGAYLFDHDGLIDRDARREIEHLLDPPRRGGLARSIGALMKTA